MKIIIYDKVKLFLKKNQDYFDFIIYKIQKLS